MTVRLTFKKDFEASGGAGKNIASLMPYTTEGEPIGDVVSCMIEQDIDSVPVMTLKVHVFETLADNIAVRLKK